MILNYYDGELIPRKNVAQNFLTFILTIVEKRGKKPQPGN